MDPEFRDILELYCITETLVTIGDMTYVREITKLTCIVVCVYISCLTQFVYFLSLFELVSLLSKQSNNTYITRYSYAGADAGYTFYRLSYL